MMEPKYCRGNFDEKLSLKIRENLKADEKYKNRCSAVKYLLDDEFLVINSIEEFNFVNEDIKKDLLSKNYNSILFFPINKEGKIYASIGVCSKYVDDFDSKTLAIFEEAKQDIEFALKKSENMTYLKLLQEALDKAYSWVLITDEDGKILYANKSVEEVSGYSFSEIFGKTPSVFKSEYHNEEFYQKLWNKISNGEIVETTLINKDKYGKSFYLKTKIIPLLAPNGKKYFIFLALDITHEKKLQNKLKKDLITGLLNRSEFVKLLKQKLNDNKYALIIVDLRDFKIFNQLNGNAQGDALLKDMAKLLKETFSNAFISRIGGDEFAVLTEYSSKNEITASINRLMHKIKHLRNFHNKISANVGIALYPEHSKDIVKLIEKAYLALEIAKQKGDFASEFFSEDIRKK
ncbi:sensor domain-containing diguanylate cyclase [Caminibacter pacificus]|nr:sensor domain-containing diguanylate cyclase [Caminibacter pacificus]